MGAPEAVDGLTWIAHCNEPLVTEYLGEHGVIELREVLGLINHDERVFGEEGRVAGWHENLIVEVNFALESEADAFVEDADDEGLLIVRGFLVQFFPKGLVVGEEAKGWLFRRG